MPTRTTARAARPSPGISRIDQEATRTHGYFVRLGYERGTDGTWRPKHRSFFGDKSYGGKRGALQAAEGWREEMMAAATKKGGGARAGAKAGGRAATGAAAGARGAKSAGAGARGG